MSFYGLQDNKRLIVIALGSVIIGRRLGRAENFDRVVLAVLEFMSRKRWLNIRFMTTP